MALILHIDTSDKYCSVALSDNEQLIALREAVGERAHASLITVLMDEMFKEKNIAPNQLQAVAVSKGPGSYTGLRIGVSAAKGICYALNIPLIAVNTLHAMANGILKEQPTLLQSDFLLCPMIDARRMEVYNAIYDSALNEKLETNAAIITNESYLTFLEQNKIYFFGSGADKCKTVITHSNAVFIEQFYSKATQLIEPAYLLFQNKRFVDTAYFEPFYLKDFVTTVSTKNLLTGK